MQAPRRARASHRHSHGPPADPDLERLLDGDEVGSGRPGGQLRHVDPSSRVCRRGHAPRVLATRTTRGRAEAPVGRVRSTRRRRRSTGRQHSPGDACRRAGRARGCRKSGRADTRTRQSRPDRVARSVERPQAQRPPGTRPRSQVARCPIRPRRLSRRRSKVQALPGRRVEERDTDPLRRRAAAALVDAAEDEPV